ncbi:MAG TPA: hypothetical protein PLH03_04460 [Methylophilaceae bacterium]|nr:hypothetical protein [Methylophilaceae bacterium]
MRKKLINDPFQESEVADHDWLQVHDLAGVELTSEDAAHQIESVFQVATASGWRAAEPGSQTIRLLFDQPQHLRLIHLDFVEPAVERTQEYVLRWSPDNGQTFYEIVRQQWNFSPSGTRSETENHAVDLANVTMLELTINPDIGNRNATASLQRWQIA